MGDSSYSFELTSETYETLKFKKEREFNECMSNATSITVTCVYCDKSVNRTLLHTHMDECHWWFEEIYKYPHNKYTPPAHEQPKRPAPSASASPAKKSKPTPVETVASDTDSEAEDNAPQFPLDRDKYHNEAMSRKKKDKNKGKEPAARECIIDQSLCKKEKNSPSTFTLVTESSRSVLWDT